MTEQSIQRKRVKYWRKNIAEGTQCLQYYKKINAWVKQRNIRTLLDYGCGKGLQYEKKFDQLIGVPREDIDLYDIGSIDHGQLPMVIYEGIIAIDVFNHIPTEFLESDMIELFRRGGDLFVTIPLNDKERTIEWWDEVFQSFSNHSTVIYHHGSRKTTKIFHANTRIG